MKNQLIKNLWMPVVGLLLFAISCKKQDLPALEETQDQTIKAFGALPEDAERMSSVPLIISKDFLARKSTTTGPRKGKGGGSTGGTTSTTTSDVTAPSVAITSPAQGASVSGTVSINVSASDNVSVSSVVVTINGTTMATLISSPYTVAWNTSNYASGVYTVEATARDAAGNWSKSTISVTKEAAVVVDPPTTTSGFALAMPPVGYQGSEYSCVAFAVGYAARSAEYFYRTGATSYSNSTNVFSPEFLYNVTKFGSDCGSGSNVSYALDYLVNNGICRWQTMPYSYTNGCSTMPSSTQTAEAANYKISGYSALYKSDVAGIKAMLQQKHPLIFTVNLDNSFTNAKAGFIWKSYTASPGAGHSLVICGYDDSKNAWKVMNSWGTSWCDSGYGWIDYDFFPQTGSQWVFVIN